MDKFGIFNLLGTLFGNKSADQDKNGDLLSLISAPNKSTPQTPQAPSENAQAEQRSQMPPLQHSMLATMKNHDEFVRRVKEQTLKRR